jgi:hypothetical protein
MLKSLMTAKLADIYAHAITGRDREEARKWDEFQRQSIAARTSSLLVAVTGIEPEFGTR